LSSNSFRQEEKHLEVPWPDKNTANPDLPPITLVPALDYITDAEVVDNTAGIDL
jgi:hypothetical protein